MSQASKPVARIGRVAFELERFELTGDRWEIEGRWFGVRGRRFMRPALSIVAGGRPTRLLADLADKPWAAEDGEPWAAAFPFPLKGELQEAELTVAPDITVAVPLPGARAPAGKAKRRVGRTAPSPVSVSRRGPRPDAASGDELASLARNLSDAETEQRRLQRELERSQAEKAQAEAEHAQTAARLDELLGQLSQAVRERDEAHTAHDQLKTDLEALKREHRRVASELDAARRAADEVTEASKAAASALDRAVAERGAAIAAQHRAESERETAIAERDQAATEREGAIALRDHALAERDAAVAARDDVVYQRDGLLRTSERLQSELADVASASGAALVMRRAAQDRAVSRRNTLTPIAIVTLIAVAVAVVLLIVLKIL